MHMTRLSFVLLLSLSPFLNAPMMRLAMLLKEMWDGGSALDSKSSKHKTSDDTAESRLLVSSAGESNGRAAGRGRGVRGSGYSRATMRCGQSESSLRSSCACRAGSLRCWGSTWYKLNGGGCGGARARSGRENNLRNGNGGRYNAGG